VSNAGSTPFLFIGDAAYRSVGWALVTAPIVTRAHHLQLRELSQAGYRFAGMTSYMTFPLPHPADPRDYGALCEAWLHCFREPDRYLPRTGPRALISYSDFIDYLRVSPANLCPKSEPGFDHDFIYAGTTEPWKQEAKNWELAARCIPRICRELDLRALIVGAPADGIEPAPNVRFTPPLPLDEFLARLARARFLLVPNLLDPSPRVLTEALCLNVPLVVNGHILGGWKYVNAFTGVFFEDEQDVVAAVRHCLERPKSPRRWYCANHGPYLAGRRLLRLLQSIDGQISERSHLVVTTRCASGSQAVTLTTRRG
jgi:glycosyltransferase involved in cell wall biosynthesis